VRVKEGDWQRLDTNRPESEIFISLTSIKELVDVFEVMVVASGLGSETSEYYWGKKLNRKKIPKSSIVKYELPSALIETEVATEPAATEPDVVEPVVVDSAAMELDVDEVAVTEPASMNQDVAEQVYAGVSKVIVKGI
jgi:hypothetical protein